MPVVVRCRLPSRQAELHPDIFESTDLFLYGQAGNACHMAEHCGSAEAEGIQVSESVGCHASQGHYLIVYQA